MKKLIDWFRRLFGKRPTTPTLLPVGEPTFVADFSQGLDLNHWNVSTWTSPGGSPTNTGVFSDKHVYIQDGALCLRLSQLPNGDGTVRSMGGEIATKQEFTYGTFEWVMRASSTARTPTAAGEPLSGSITGCFIYRDRATTEIDFEVEGNERHHFTQLTSWTHESAPNEHTKVPPGSGRPLPHQDFIRYAFKWMPDRIEFYREGVLIGTHREVVPTLPARVMINHWGTNSKDWGGLATPHVARFVWIKRFKYTPL